jgi:beta-N-acetylhexosaminidase
MRLVFISILLLLFSSANIKYDSKTGTPAVPKEHIYLRLAERYADSAISHFSLDEKIGQLFMIEAYSNRSEDHYHTIEKLIKQYHIGGIIFFKGNPTKQAVLTNRFQDASRIPLFIAMDAEWGLSMRLDSTISFPKQMTLGAMDKNYDTLIYQMGREVARQCRRIGVNISFSPVLDINNNPSNPVIHMRAFGEDKYKVARKSIAYMKGLQDGKVLAVAKHFPGHGDTDKDSHFELPVIRHNKKRLDDLELYPYREIIKNGAAAIMIAHLHIPELDSRKNRPSTLSKNIVSDILKKELNFKGLIFTDALNMEGISKYWKTGDIEVEALQAGNDILLFSKSIPTAFEAIKSAVLKGKIPLSDIEEKIRKILIIKYLLRIDKKVNTENIVKYLNSRDALRLKQNIISKCLSYVGNNQKLLPLQQLHLKKIASLSIGEKENNTFQEHLKLYGNVDCFRLTENPNIDQFIKIAQKLDAYDLVILSLHHLHPFKVVSFGLNPYLVRMINDLKNKDKILMVVFGSPYAIKKFPSFSHFLIAYEDGEDYQKLCAEAIYGGISIQGKLPVSIPGSFVAGSGTETEARRLRYCLPEDLGISSEKLSTIDRVVSEAIQAGAMPGCQILIAKNRSVFFHRSYGYHTYDSLVPVDNNDIYDLASISKVASTLLPLMRFYNINRISIYDSIGKYIPDTFHTGIGQVLIREILLHESGLKAWIPFYTQTLDKEKLVQESLYRKEACDGFRTQIAKNLYILDSYPDSMYAGIMSSKLRDRGKYVYSDLGFIILKRIIDSFINNDLDTYLKRNFYGALGMDKSGFNPYQWYPVEKIVPSEEDNYFRHERVQGYVHDMAAAMFGGISGHAGLFSNANDLAKLFQMFLDNGIYGGERYFSTMDIKEFTSRQSIFSRRGLGFDKAEVQKFRYSPVSRSASEATYGHTGFTGTCVWVDPEYELMYIFLSNRTYPSMKNRKLIEMGVRTKIQDIIYQAIQEKH